MCVTLKDNSYYGQCQMLSQFCSQKVVKPSLIASLSKVKINYEKLFTDNIFHLKEFKVITALAALYFILYLPISARNIISKYTLCTVDQMHIASALYCR